MSNLLKRMQGTKAEQRNKQIYDKYREYEEFKGSELVGYGLPELYLLVKNPTYRIEAGSDLNGIYNALIGEGVKEEEMGIIGTTIFTRNSKAIETMPILTEEINYGKEIIRTIGSYYNETRGNDLKGIAYATVMEIENPDSVMDKATLDTILDTIEESVYEQPEPKDFHINNVTRFEEYINNPTRQIIITRWDVSKHQDLSLREIHEGLRGRIQDLVDAIDYVDNLIERRLRHRLNAKEVQDLDVESNEIRMNLIDCREEGARTVVQIAEQLHNGTADDVAKIRELERYRGDYEPMEHFYDKVKHLTERIRGISVDNKLLKLKKDLFTSQDRGLETLRENLYETIQVESKKYDFLTYCIETGGQGVPDYFSKLV